MMEKEFLLVGMSMLILPLELANFNGFSSILFRPHPKLEHIPSVNTE